MVATTPAITMGTTARTNQFWTATVNVTCRTAGAGGTVIANGVLDRFTTTTATTPALLMGSTTVPSAITVDTTVPQTVQMSATWSVANTGHTITVQQLIVDAGN
jgi:hypothetical protein